MEQFRRNSVFEETYRREPDDVAFCLYRISPPGVNIITRDENVLITSYEEKPK